MLKRLPALLAVVAGLGLALLRAFFLVNAVEPDTGLIRKDNSLAAVLAAAAILCGLLLLFMASRYTMPKRAVPQEGNRLWAGFGIAAALFLAGFGGCQVFLALDGEYFRFIIGGLAFLTLGGHLYTARRIAKGDPRLSGASGIWASIPVFFFCSVMVMNFLEYAGQPGVSLYIYGALAIIFAALSQYRISGFFFRGGKHRSAQFYTLTALMLSLLTAGGFLLAGLLASELHPYIRISIPNLLLFGFVLFHMSAIAAGFSSGLYDFGLPSEEPPKETAPPEAESADEIVLDYLADNHSDGGTDEESDIAEDSETFEEQ